jgi:hypothetical protein
MSSLTMIVSLLIQCRFCISFKGEDTLRCYYYQQLKVYNLVQILSKLSICKEDTFNHMRHVARYLDKYWSLGFCLA